MSTAEPNHIIAIGASAGGMEEIYTFFDHTPLDAVSYVIVQHLSSDFKSRMVELLAKHSKLVVQEAKDGMMVKSNEVYLIPNDKFMTIKNSKLHLSNKEDEKGVKLTINKFFISLAEDIGKKAIGIILSGLGSDGSEGVKAIKKAGGMVMARTPETSDFPSMPSKAIATGMVDFILEPSNMPDGIEEYVNMESKLLAEILDDEQKLITIIDLIKEKSPLDFSDYKQATLLRRTKRRAAYNNFNTIGDYLNFLRETPEEVEVLSKEFLISVTSFFRDKGAFDFIQKKIFPDILSKLLPGEELKMWVAGCATGEEVYSLAILLSELLIDDYTNTIVKIFATDVDSIALIHAGKGLYSAESLKNVSAERLNNCFTKEGTNYLLKPTLRKMVIFAQHDMVKNPPYCNMHFISCRNLLIYMTPVLQKKIFNMLLFGLKKDGYLFLGSSENPMPIIKNLEVINKEWKIFKNLKAKRVVNFDAFSMPNFTETKLIVPSYSEVENPKNTIQNILAEEINIGLADELDYVAICVDESNSVVKHYGDTSKYLLPKHFSLNLTELLPKPLAIAFNTLRNNVLKTNEKGSVKGIKIKQGDVVKKINLSISPLITKKSNQKLLLVTFKDEELPTLTSSEEIAYDDKIYLDQYTINLEGGIKELKDKLQSTYEQLDASNENMQSFNEEMVSANEEMQSTNEEMQSVNEELDTINADYQLKNKELLEINDDLNNYFRSNVNGQLFVDNDFRLVKFSPGTVKQINLLENDIGRPLANITTNIKFETIIEDIQQVFNTGNIVTKEVETDNGKWYQIMTMPYMQQAYNKRSGAIITFNDITELKKTQLELDNKNQSLLRINADLDNFVHTTSHDLLGPLANIEFSISVMNELEVKDDKLTEYLNIINSSVKKFRSLITEIATIAKIEGDMIEMELVDVEDVIKDIEWSLETKIKSSEALIKKNLQVKHILFSKKNLRSILYNLISNGIKFKGTDSPVLDIKTFKEGGNVVLSVKDNGLGISKVNLDKIFEMYGRVNHSIEGHGIGLFLAKKIVDAAGGNIIVESEIEKGSNFIVYFRNSFDK